MSPIQRSHPRPGGATARRRRRRHRAIRRSPVRRQGGRRDRCRLGDRPGGGPAPGRGGCRGGRPRRRRRRRSPTVAGIAADGGAAAAYTCDVTSESSVEPRRWRPSPADLGPPTVVCNVAGIGGFFNTAEMPLEPVAADPGRQPDRPVPGLPGRPAPPARARRVHRQRGLEHGADGPGLLGRLLRLQGRPADVHQGAGRRVPGAGGAGQRGGPGRDGHPAASARSTCPRGPTRSS